jgi:hypothetical protein
MSRKSAFFRLVIFLAAFYGIIRYAPELSRETPEEAAATARTVLTYKCYSLKRKPIAEMSIADINQIGECKALGMDYDH